MRMLSRLVQDGYVLYDVNGVIHFMLFLLFHLNYLQLLWWINWSRF